jgi:hypothetical protein
VNLDLQVGPCVLNEGRLKLALVSACESAISGEVPGSRCGQRPLGEARRECTSGWGILSERRLDAMLSRPLCTQQQQEARLAKGRLCQNRKFADAGSGAERCRGRAQWLEMVKVLWWWRWSWRCGKWRSGREI